MILSTQINNKIRIIPGISISKRESNVELFLKQISDAYFCNCFQMFASVVSGLLSQHISDTCSGFCFVFCGSVLCKPTNANTVEIFLWVKGKCCNAIQQEMEYKPKPSVN